ncbi:MAG: disulfide bond formation protein B [Geminicoccaceae bacterium]
MPRSGRAWLLLSGLLAAAALAVAYALQYLGGYQPCQLCYWQRYPYFAVLAVTALGVALGRPRHVLLLAAALFLVTAGIAWYHVGVEQGMFALPTGCAAGGEATSIAELKAQLATAAPACDQVGLTILGLSLSNWNALAGMAFALVGVAGWLRTRS